MATTRLGPQDGAQARELVRRFTGSERADPSAFLADPRCFLLVATEDDEAVGWLYAYELVRPDGRKEMLLYELEVAEEHRGRGHGRALLAALSETARRRGHFELWTLTDPGNAAAAALYGGTGGSPTAQTMFTWPLDE